MSDHEMQKLRIRIHPKIGFRPQVRKVQEDQMKTGISLYGKTWVYKAANRKLSDDDVRYIRASDESNKEMALKFGVVPSLISAIRKFKERRNVK